jgi:site-specific DNA recombinase
MLGILWVFAELERDMILERTSGGYEEAQKNWVWMQDRYGYIRDDKTKRPININEKEAEIIKDIYERYVYFRNWE